MPDENTKVTVEDVKARLKAMQDRQDGAQKELAGAREKDIRPIAGKPAKKKFRTELKEAIFPEGIKGTSIPKHILFNLMIPACKRIFADMANSAINMALGLDPKTRTVGASHAANASAYRDRNFARTGTSATGYSGREAVSEFIWDEETAIDIVTQIGDILDRYPSITLSNVLSIMNMPERIKTTDRYWGWDSMRGIDMVCVDEVDKLYRIEFPPVKRIV